MAVIEQCSFMTKQYTQTRMFMIIFHQVGKMREQVSGLEVDLKTANMKIQTLQQERPATAARKRSAISPVSQCRYLRIVFPKVNHFDEYIQQAKSENVVIEK